MERDIIFKSFQETINLKKKKKLTQYLNKIKILQWPKFFESFKKNYQYSYNKNLIKKYIKHKTINIIGMGGSSLGSKAIYNFLRSKIKKKFSFFENLTTRQGKVS